MYFSRHHALLNLHQTRRSSVCMDGQTYSILSSERSQLFCLAGYESSRKQHVLRKKKKKKKKKNGGPTGYTHEADREVLLGICLRI